MSDQTKPNAETPKPQWWCCRADYPNHEAGCRNFEPETQAGAMEAREFAEWMSQNGEPGDIRQNNKYLACFRIGQQSALAARDARRDADAWEAGASWMLEAITGSLRGYPDHGGDIQVMAEVDRLRADARKIGETVALREAAVAVVDYLKAYRMDSKVLQVQLSNAIATLIPSDGQSLVDKHDAEILKEAANVGFKAAFKYLGMDKTQREYNWHDVSDALKKGSDAILVLISAQPEKPKGLNEK
jgi:hypothetical protein